MARYRFDRKLGRVAPVQAQDAVPEVPGKIVKGRKKGGDFDGTLVSTQFPRNYKHHRDAGGTFDERGRCVFTSRAQMFETAARGMGEGDNVIFDDKRD